MVLRETGAKLLIIKPMRMPMKDSRRSHNEQILARYSCAAKYSAGHVLERPRVTAAFVRPDRLSAIDCNER